MGIIFHIFCAFGVHYCFNIFKHLDWLILQCCAVHFHNLLHTDKGSGELKRIGLSDIFNLVIFSFL